MDWGHWAGGSPSRVDELSALLFEVWTEYEHAGEEIAEAKRQYARAFRLAFIQARAEACPATILVKVAENDELAVEARIVQDLKEESRRTLLKKWETVHAQLMAAMSNQRMVREQT